MSLVERVSYNSVIIQRDPLLALFTLDLRNTLSWCTYGASFQRALVVPGIFINKQGEPVTNDTFLVKGSAREVCIRMSKDYNN